MTAASTGFEDIVDIDTGKVLFTIEHEIRSDDPSALPATAGQSQPGAVEPHLFARRRCVEPDPCAGVWGPGNMVADPLKAAKAPTLMKRRAARMAAEAARS